MTTHPSTVPSNSIPVTNPNEIVTVYANTFAATATMTDFTLHFLEVGQTPGSKGSIQRHELKASVTLPMLAAAGLQQVLEQVVLQQKMIVDAEAAKAETRVK